MLGNYISVLWNSATIWHSKIWNIPTVDRSRNLIVLRHVLPSHLSCPCDTQYCWWFRNPKQPPGMFLKTLWIMGKKQLPFPQYQSYGIASLGLGIILYPFLPSSDWSGPIGSMDIWYIYLHVHHKKSTIHAGKCTRPPWSIWIWYE